MSRFLRLHTFLGLGLLLVAVLAVALMMNAGRPHTAHAATSCVQVDEAEWVCLTLTPETASNPVGTSHTVTAYLTEGPSEADQSALLGEYINFSVVVGPNAWAIGVCDPASCKTNGVGEVTFTYTDAAGDVDNPDIILGCYYALVPQLAIDQVLVSDIPVVEICDEVDKDWFVPSTPTPTPTPTATPTPAPTATPTVLAATATPAPTPTPEPSPAVLPVTGGAPPDGNSSSLAWLAAIAGAIAVMSASGFWFAYQRRRVR